MHTIAKGFKFHGLSVDTEITYTVLSNKNENLLISFIKNNEYAEIEVPEQMIQDYLSEGRYKLGQGSDRMMVLVRDGYLSTGWSMGRDQNTYKTKLESLRGKWVEVETTYLFNNQYNVEGLRLHDEHIVEIKNDQRYGPTWEGKNKPFFQRIGGVMPSTACFYEQLLSDRGPLNSETLWDNDNVYFPDNFHLSTGAGHFVYTNNRRTNVKFIYKDGVFFDVSTGRVLKDVSIKPMKALVKFFETYYK